MFNDIFDSIYSICLTLFSITIAILLKFFINKRKVKTFKLSIVNHEFDIFPSIIFGFGITLCFMEILKYIIFGCVYKEPHLYLYTPVFISSYFIVFFLGYSLTKKDSKFNHM
ncbi:hypothetical protein FACS189459_0100 [Bacilli bacterium]|nr:hypothetical protein FACS189459_0100 [Bacilli bacterium]